MATEQRTPLLLCRKGACARIPTRFNGRGRTGSTDEVRHWRLQRSILRFSLQFRTSPLQRSAPCSPSPHLGPCQPAHGPRPSAKRGERFEPSQTICIPSLWVRRQAQPSHVAYFRAARPGLDGPKPKNIHRFPLLVREQDARSATVADRKNEVIPNVFTNLSRYKSL